jgi:tetratricopeptide (TPR) repeat protein
VYEITLFPEVEYTFKHALTHEVTYGGLLQERRRTLHGRIVDAIRRLHADRLVEHVERLAHHALRAESWDTAVEFAREAGVRALTRSANREATEHFEEALGALRHVAECRQTIETAIDLRLDLYRCLLPLDELRPLMAHLREAEALALRLGDQERLGWVRLHICHLLVLIDDARAGVQLGHEVVGLAEAIGNRAIEARAFQWIGCGYYALGQHRRAVDFLRRCVASQSGAGSQDRLIGVTGGSGPGPRVTDVFRPGYIAMFLAELGEFSDAETAAEMTLQSPATTPDRPWDFAVAQWQIAWFWCLKGELRRAAAMATRAVDVGRRWGLRRANGTAMALLGHIFAIEGRVAEAVELVEQGVREAQEFGTTWLLCPRLFYLAEAYLLAGRTGDAAQTADRALTLARQRGERGFEAWVLRTQADIAAAGAPGTDELAAGRYREAMVLAGELGMRPLIAHCHAGVAKLCRRTGKPQQADEHFTTATTMYRDMGMTYWLEKAEAEQKA